MSVAPTKPNAKGRLSQVIGAVVDVEFDGDLPAIMNALETKNIDAKTGDRVTLDLTEHIGPLVQAIAILGVCLEARRRKGFRAFYDGANEPWSRYRAR